MGQAPEGAGRGAAVGTRRAVVQWAPVPSAVRSRGRGGVGSAAPRTVPCLRNLGEMGFVSVYRERENLYYIFLGFVWVFFF